MDRRRAIYLPLLLIMFGFVLSNTCLAVGYQLLGFRTFDQAGNILSLGNGAGITIESTYHLDGSIAHSFNLSHYQQQAFYSAIGQVTHTTVVKHNGNPISADNNAYVAPIDTAYFANTHWLKSVNINGPHPVSTDYTYFANGLIRTLQHTFTLTNASAADTLSYQYGPITTGLLVQRDSHGNALDYAYGNTGIQSITHTRNAHTDFTVGYTHGSMGRVLTITRDPGLNTYNVYNRQGQLIQIIIGASKNTPTLSYTYQYGVTGNPLTISIVSNTSKAKGTIAYGYTYNTQNQLVGYHVISSTLTSGSAHALYATDAFGNAIQSRDYTYGLNNNIHTVTTTLASQVAQHHPSIEMTYGYRNSVGYPDQLRTISTSSLQTGYPATELTAMEQLNRLPYHYNRAGGMTQDPEGNVYVYNANNQLIQGQSPVGSVQHYRYSAAGLVNYEQSSFKRAAHGNIKHPNLNGLPIVYYYGQGANNLVAQQQGLSTQKNPSNQVNSFYLPGLATFTHNSLLGSGASTPTVTNPITALYEVAQGNVALTTSNHKITHEYTYTPFGQTNDIYHPTIVKTNTAGDNTFSDLINQTRHVLRLNHNTWTYTGQQTDQSTGLLNIGHFRMYAPDTMRSIEPDLPQNTFDLGVTNLFAYVQDNPMAYTDHSGHMPTPTADEAIEAMKQTLRALTGQKDRAIQAPEDLDEMSGEPLLRALTPATVNPGDLIHPDEIQTNSAYSRSRSAATSRVTSRHTSRNTSEHNLDAAIDAAGPLAPPQAPPGALFLADDDDEEIPPTTVGGPLSAAPSAHALPPDAAGVAGPAAPPVTPNQTGLAAIPGETPHWAHPNAVIAPVLGALRPDAVVASIHDTREENRLVGFVLLGSVEMPTGNILQYASDGGDVPYFLRYNHWRYPSDNHYPRGRVRAVRDEATARASGAEPLLDSAMFYYQEITPEMSQHICILPRESAGFAIDAVPSNLNPTGIPGPDDV